MGSQLAIPSARIQQDPFFLPDQRQVMHIPHSPSVICTSLLHHDPQSCSAGGTGHVSTQSCLRGVSGVSNIEAEHTQTSLGTKWRRVWPSSPFLALVLHTPQRYQVLWGPFPPTSSSNPTDVSARLSSFIVRRQAPSCDVVSAISQ